MDSNRIKLVIFALILVAIGTLLTPIVIDATFDTATDAQTDAFPACVVAGGATDVVLTEDLLSSNTIYVSAMTATGAGAVPVANTYTAATNTLNITGLGADTPQDVTVTYSYDAVAGYNGVGPVLWIIPLLVILGIVIVVIFNGLWALKSGKQ